MILGLREEGAIASALQEIGALTIIDGIADLSAQRIEAPQLNAWLRRACFADTDAVAQFLSQVHAPFTSIVPAISQLMPPDAGHLTARR